MRLPAASPSGRTATAAAQEPIRVHADWSAEGVRIWLGVDAVMQDSLPAIQQQIQRWLTAQGVRLLGISCNGRSLPADMSLAELTSDAHAPLPQPGLANALKGIS
jgi:hypothetical protein